MRQLKREGFSLVEMLIVIAISSIVLAGVVTLIGFGTRNMRITQARVALQDEAKDAMTHITSYAMEATEASWSDSDEMLTIVQETVDDDESVTSTQKYYYFLSDGCVYFFDDSSVQYQSWWDHVSDSEKKKYLLLSDVTDFQCEVNENEGSEKYTLHVTISLSDGDVAEFTCDKDITMRNQS